MYEGTWCRKHPTAPLVGQPLQCCLCRIEELEEQLRWRSVIEDEYPFPGIKHLVLRETGTVDLDMHVGSDDKSKWYIHYDVTHWMPIPPLPDKAREGK